MVSNGSHCYCMSPTIPRRGNNTLWCWTTDCGVDGVSFKEATAAIIEIERGIGLFVLEVLTQQATAGFSCEKTMLAPLETPPPVTLASR